MGHSRRLSPENVVTNLGPFQPTLMAGRRTRSLVPGGLADLGRVDTLGKQTQPPSLGFIFVVYTTEMLTPAQETSTKCLLRAGSQAGPGTAQVSTAGDPAPGEGVI